MWPRFSVKRRRGVGGLGSEWIFGHVPFKYFMSSFCRLWMGWTGIFQEMIRRAMRMDEIDREERYSEKRRPRRH